MDGNHQAAGKKIIFMRAAGVGENGVNSHGLGQTAPAGVTGQEVTLFPLHFIESTIKLSVPAQVA